MKKITTGFLFACYFIVSQLNAQVLTVSTTTINFTQKIPPGYNSVGLNFKVSGTGLVANIDINTSGIYEMATSISGPWSSSVSLIPSGGTVTTTNLYVRYSPVAPGPASGSISIMSTGATSRTINLNSFAMANAPTISSCITSVTANSGNPLSAIDIVFTAGNGNGRVIVLRPLAGPNVFPVNGTAYLSINDWDAAANTVNEISVTHSNRIIYVGSGTSITVTGLSSSTVYCARIFEFNNGGFAGAESYLTGGVCSAKSGTTGSGSYTWTGAISNDFAVAGNWSPNRNTLSNSDILNFTSSPSGDITNITTQTIGQLNISGSNTNVSLQASSNATLTITGIVSSSTSFSLTNGCSLTLKGGNTITIPISKNASILGNVTIQDGNHIISCSGTVTNSGTFTYEGNAPVNISNINYNNLVISATASAAVTAPASIIVVTGNFTGHSMFVHNGGTIQMTGYNVSISGSSTFNNLTFSGTGITNKSITAGASNMQYIIGTLTVSSGVQFNTNGNITLLSTASSTGRIAPIAGTFTGNITMQRYIPGGPRNYIFHLGTPVSGATVASWQPTQFNGSGQPTNGFYITGPFAGASNPGFGIGSTQSMYGFDAANGVWGYYPYTSNTQPLTPGVGYRVQIRDGSAAYFSGLYCEKTISVTGAPTKGDFNFNLAYNSTGGGTPEGGWNLIGNPYPSDITADLTNGGWNTTAANLGGNDVYIWSSVANNFVACNGGAGNCIIPSSQGFWVRTTDAGTLTASESVKVAGSTTIYKESVADLFNIKLTSDAYEGYDNTYVRYAANASDDFDSEYDALEPFFLYPDDFYQLGVYTQSAHNSFSINTFPLEEDKNIIPLYVKAPKGNALLEFEGLDRLGAEYEVYIQDVTNNTIVDLKQVSVYPFTVSENTIGYGEHKFNIIVAKSNVRTDKVSSINMIAYPNPAPAGTGIILSSDVAGDGLVNIIITDNTGRVVFVDNVQVANDKLRYTIQSDNLAPGLYVVTCKGSKTLFTKLAIH